MPRLLLHGGTDILCAPSTNAGGFQANGAHLSWGIDLDGAGAGTTVSEIEVRDATGTAVVARLAGLVANLAVSANGAITSSNAEFRRGASAGEGCANHIRWDGSRITCGDLSAAPVVISGAVRRN